MVRLPLEERSLLEIDGQMELVRPCVVPGVRVELEQISQDWSQVFALEAQGEKPDVIQNAELWGVRGCLQV